MIQISLSIQIINRTETIYPLHKTIRMIAVLMPRFNIFYMIHFIEETNNNVEERIQLQRCTVTSFQTTEW